MKVRIPQKVWVAYVVALAGVAISVLGWDLLNYAQEEFGLFGHLEDYNEFFYVLGGAIFSVLLGFAIRIYQIAQSRAFSLEKAEEDLTRVKAEQETAQASVEQLENALKHSQKLQAVGTLAGGIAHDFNNILYAIIGYTEITREDLKEDTLAYKNLGKVLDAAQKGQDLISRILSFSRKQQHKLDPTDVTETIESALSLLRPTIPASVDIVFQPNFTMCVLVNQTQIHQVLVNLITNAVDAMDGEGKVTISTALYNVNDPDVEPLAKKPIVENYVKINVTDSGKGMDQASMDRIFEPFFTKKEVGQGTGLGLSIVHNIIEEHGGEIKVKSRLGEGTTFTIYLPEYTPA